MDIYGCLFAFPLHVLKFCGVCLIFAREFRMTQCWHYFASLYINFTKYKTPHHSSSPYIMHIYAR